MTDWPKNLSLSFGDAEFLEAALAEYLVKKGPGEHSVGVYGRVQGLLNGPGDGPERDLPPCPVCGKTTHGGAPS